MHILHLPLRTGLGTRTREFYVECSDTFCGAGWDQVVLEDNCFPVVLESFASFADAAGM
jgi:hypothetical protein